MDVFVRKPTLATVISLVILLLGGWAFLTIPIRQYPKMQSAAITIETQYPGAEQSLIQGFLTIPISKSIATADGIDYVTSISTEGRSLIKARLRIDADSSRSLGEIMAKVQQIKYLLPRDAYDPVIDKVTDDPTAVMYLAVKSTRLPIPEITDWVTRAVQPLIVSSDGVASAQIMGGRNLAMRVWLDPAKLSAHDITAAEVSRALADNNVQSAAGQVKGARTALSVTANTDTNTPESFGRMVLKAGPGGLVRLEDVARIELGGDSYDQSAFIDGKPAVVIAIKGTPLANPLDIVASMKALLPGLERSKPPGVEIVNVFDVARFVEAALAEVRTSLVEAIVIVVVVVLLFLGSGRAVLIPLVTIPLSLIGAIGLMYAVGFSLNLLTLLAMVLAIGLVVDDAIVVVENIHRQIEAGRPAREAAITGAREVTEPVVAMTITLAAVYTPIGLIGGLTGTLFREFAFTLAGAVIVSGVVALTLSPMMSALLLRPSPQRGPQLWIEHGFAQARVVYAQLLAPTLRCPAAMLFVCMLAGAASVVFFLGAQREFAPSEDQGTVVEVAKAPRYANLDYTEHYSVGLEAAFRRLPEAGTSWVFNGMNPAEPGPQGVFAGINLVDWHRRQRSAASVMAQLQAEAARNTGLGIFAFLLPALPSATPGLPVQIVLRGAVDYPTLYEANRSILKAARDSCLFAVVDSDLAWDKSSATMTIDRARANELGVTMQDVAQTLSVLVGEKYVNRFAFRGRSYDVIPQVERSFRSEGGDLGRFYVRSAAGRLLPLATFAEHGRRSAPNQLGQFNQMNAATVSAVLAPGVSMGRAVAFLQGKADQLPPGLSVAWLGESRQYVSEGDHLTQAFGLALVAIFLVLVVQFGTFRDPVIVLLSVPLSLAGALLPLWLGYATLNIFTQIGLVTLVGLISKHGILMTAFANELQREQGLAKKEAIAEAARLRLRPILMTTAAMIAGLLPLVFAEGAGAASRFAIGIVVVSGLSIGTILVLTVLPGLYILLARDHRLAESYGTPAATRPA